jgi:hypothetical protein
MPSGSAKSAKSGVLPAPNVGEYPIDQRCFAVKFHSELMADSATLSSDAVNRVSSIVRSIFNPSRLLINA